MNRKQQIVLWLIVAACVAMVGHPPFVAGTSHEYFAIWYGCDLNWELDTYRLGFQLLVMAALGGGLIRVLKTPPRQ